jgi:uncharacterized membrane protein
MKFRQRLSGLFASDGARAIFTFVGILAVVVAVVLFLATVAAAITGNWSLPGVVASIIFFVAILSGYFLFRALLLLVLFFFPVLIAIIVTWTGYRTLIERSKKAKNEASSNREQPVTN